MSLFGPTRKEEMLRLCARIGYNPPVRA